MGNAQTRPPERPYYLGKPLAECTREELIECIEYLAPFQQEVFDNRRAIALGKVETLPPGDAQSDVLVPCSGWFRRNLLRPLIYPSGQPVKLRDLDRTPGTMIRYNQRTGVLET